MDPPAPDDLPGAAVGDEPRPRTGAGSRAGRRATEPRAASPGHGSSGPDAEPAVGRPGVDIRPPRWLAVATTAFAGLGGGLGVLAAVGLVAQGDPLGALGSLVAGAVFAAVVFDAAGRRATTDGDRLVLHQWYREVVLQRSEITAFRPSRVSLWRWDVVAERREPHRGRHDVRLWATHQLTAGHRARRRWLEDLERWLTASPRPTPPAPRAGPDRRR